MNGQPGFVLRSLRPDITASAIEAARVARSQAVKRAEEWCEFMFHGHTLSGYEMFDGSFSVLGFVPPSDGRRDVPPGWRWDTKTRAVVPAKRTPEGKAAAEELRGLGFTHPEIDGLGGIVSASDTPPDTPTHLSRGYFTGWTFLILGDEVFAALGPRYLTDRHAQAVIDAGDRWAPARLSEFHAAQEGVE